jgi:polyisoprenoid-binding protein YceI
MKRFVAFLLLSAFALPAAAADTYTIDPDHTSIVWRISHFGLSFPAGKFAGAEGRLVLDEARPQNSTLNVTVRPENILTGIPKLDEHLKSADFFDVAKFPVATFVSSRIETTGKDSAKVYGTLTLHGVSKPLMLDVKLNKIAYIEQFKRKKAGFSATAIIKRSDFGITYGLPDVGDEARLWISSEAWYAP